MQQKILSYNVNGIRAAMRKGFTSWLKAAQPDILCIQETKATEEQVDVAEFEALGYHHYWFSAEKKGYSGVAILSKEKPLHLTYGCGIDKYDREGRVLIADYAHFSVMSVYMPSGSSGDARQAFKLEWLSDFRTYCKQLLTTRPKLLISGDYNICHQAIDIHNPIRNTNTSGFTPEERDWMTQFLNEGFADAFRQLNPEGGNYSWWSYRAGARAKNLGWRIDYHLISDALQPHLAGANILNAAKHSDHCPVSIQLEF
jgi:exodeoxyribonuclease-3